MNLNEELQAALAEYESHNNLGALLDTVKKLSKDADLDDLIAAAEPLKERPEIAMPVYEHVIAQRPNDARAMVILANAYWLTGRGHDVVGELATRARTVDPSNRGAWHLWALSESNNRERMERWRQVTERFPDDKLARAALADNATSLAGAEQDPLALELAIRTYEGLWAEAPNAQQREALETTLEKLREWKM